MGAEEGRCVCVCQFLSAHASPHVCASVVSGGWIGAVTAVSQP